MLLFFENSCKKNGRCPYLSVLLTTINPTSSTVYCGVHVTRDQIRLVCKSQKQDNSFSMLSIALVSRRVTCQRSSLMWTGRKTEFSRITIWVATAFSSAKQLSLCVGLRQASVTAKCYQEQWQEYSGYNPPGYSVGRHVFFSRNLSGLSGGRWYH